MTPRDLRNIHTTGNSCRYTFVCENDTKTTPVFLPADGEASCWLLPSLVSQRLTEAKIDNSIYIVFGRLKFGTQTN